MRPYGPSNRDFGVQAFELHVDSITVEFKDGSVYLYNHSCTGIANVQQMKQLALLGEGLDSYIHLFARRAHAARIR